MDKIQFLKDLNNEFRDFTFEMESFSFGGTLPLFFIDKANEASLARDWLKITDYIATNFQVNVATDFERWNIYLFFLVRAPIDRALKYTIENDTWSSRKIVVENSKNHARIIEEHITNGDLLITPDMRHPANFLCDRKIASAIGEKPIKVERLRTGEAMRVLDKIRSSITPSNEA